MTDAISGVRYGEVTTAVRDSSAAGRYPIHDVITWVSRVMAPLMLSALMLAKVTL